MAPLDVLLPAGGLLPDVAAARFGTPYKSLTEIRGQTVLKGVLDAVRGLPQVRHIVLAGEAAVLDHPDAQAATIRAPGGRSGPETLLNGLQRLAQEAAPRMLVVTTDLPYLRAEHLADFLERCGEAELCAPILTDAEFAARFPDSTNTYLRLADGRWTAGGAYRVDSAAFLRALPHIERLFQQRKSPLGMARLLGPAFAVRFAMGRLTVPEVLGKVQAITGCRGEPVRGCAPELAYDLDDIEDYEYALRHA